MPKRFRLHQPQQVRTYQLNDLNVPPKRYAWFLSEAVQEFKRIILEENGCKTLDQVTKKYHNSLRKANSGRSVSPEDVPSFASLGLGIDAILEYHSYPDFGKSLPASKYWTAVYTEHLDPGITEEDGRSAKFVRYFREELDKKFPKRNGKMPNFLFSDKPAGERGSAPTSKEIAGFRFDLELSSIATSLLEAKVQLTNHGFISGRNGLREGYAVPAIRIEAKHISRGSMALPRKVVNALGKVVAKYYQVTEIEHQSRYAQEIPFTVHS